MRKLISALAVASLLTVSALPAALACEGHDKKASAEKAKEKPAKLATASYKIEGMHCAGCGDKVKAALASKDGIYSVKIDVAGKRAIVEFDAAKLDATQVAKMISETGYKATAEV
jgi:copper chaperone CopZ